MGIATVALIDSTVRVTMRQSDNVPNASEVVMAPEACREDVTAHGCLRSRPCRVTASLVQIFVTRDESPAADDVSKIFAMITGNNAAG